MIFEDSSSRSDLLGTLCGACYIIIAQQVEGQFKTKFLGELFKSEDKDKPQARQTSIPSGKIFLHRGQVSSGIASIDTYRQRVRFPSAEGSNAS